MAGVLPPTDDIAALRAAIARDEPWTAPMRTIAERHGVSGPLVRAPTGSSVVYLAGDAHVIKLYAPIWRAQLDVEGDVLARLGGDLGVATPALDARGELEGWPYLVMRRLPGAPLRAVWDRVPPADRAAILEQLGAALRALHAVDPTGLRVLDPPWPALLARRLDALAPDRGAFVDEHAPGLATAPRALVHADAHHEHVLLEERAGRWTMTGLFDFADVRLAPVEYDLVTPCAFIVRGDRALATALLRGVGYRDADLDADLARRLFAFELLHVWADLARDAAMVGTERQSLDELALAFWPLG